MGVGRERIWAWIAVIALGLSMLTGAAFLLSYSHDQADLRKVVCGTFVAAGNTHLPPHPPKDIATIVAAARHGAIVAKCPGVKNAARPQLGG